MKYCEDLMVKNEIPILKQQPSTMIEIKWQLVGWAIEVFVPKFTFRKIPIFGLEFE